MESVFETWLAIPFMHPWRINLKRTSLSFSHHEKGKNRTHFTELCGFNEIILAPIKFSINVSYLCVVVAFFLVQNGEITVGWWNQGKWKMTPERMEKIILRVC